MKKKSILSLALAGVLTMGLMGCGSKDAADDKTIKIRAAVAINLCEHDIIDFDQDNIPTDVLVDLVQSIAYNIHTLYIEVGEIGRFDNIFNISQQWK